MIGLPTMGFLNPTLYEVARSTPEAFNDITTGSNACGVGRSLETAPCCDHGFASTPGWDATTGPSHLPTYFICLCMIYLLTCLFIYCTNNIY